MRKKVFVICLFLVVVLCLGYFYLRVFDRYNKEFVIVNQKVWVEAFHSEKDPFGVVCIKLKGDTECDIELMIKEKVIDGDTCKPYERKILIKRDDVDGWNLKTDWYSPDIIVGISSKDCVIDNLKVYVNM